MVAGLACSIQVTTKEKLNVNRSTVKRVQASVKLKEAL